MESDGSPGPREEVPSTVSAEPGTNMELRKTESAAGCCTDLLDNVMDQTANLTCPIGGGKSGSVNGLNDESHYEDDGGRATSKNEGKDTNNENGRDLDQELNDLDMDYNMFDASATSIEEDDNDEDNANKKINKEDKKPNGKLQADVGEVSQQVKGTNEKGTGKATQQSKHSEKKNKAEGAAKADDGKTTPGAAAPPSRSSAPAAAASPSRSSAAAAKTKARNTYSGPQQKLSASSLGSSISSMSQSESKWDKRATRPEIFDINYSPTRPEEYEVATLAASLGVPKPSRFGMPGRTVARLSPILFPRPGQMKVVLMRQGRAVPVYQSTVAEASSNDNAPKTIKDVEEQELCHLNHVHLLTNAIIFSSNVASTKARGGVGGGGGGDNKGAPGVGPKQHSFNSRFLQGRNPRQTRRASDDSIEMERAADAASAAATADRDESDDDKDEAKDSVQGPLQEQDSRPSLERRQSFHQRNAQSFRNFVAGSQRFAGVLAEGTARMITGPVGPRAERMSALTAVVDLEYWPLSTVLHPADTATTRNTDDEEEDDESDSDNDKKNFKPSDDSSEGTANLYVCLVFDNTRFFIMKLHDQYEKQHWLTSIRSCAMGHNKQVTAGNDTIDVEESARRMHRVMKTTLCSAAMHGKPDVVEKYLMTSKDSVRETDGLGNTAAYYAVQQGHNVCLAMLLDAGADPNALDHEERTLASLALDNKNLRAVEMLEASGAKLSTEERDAMQKMMDDALSAEKGKRGDEGEGGSAAGGESDAKGAMADAMNQLNERGEKLQELDQKTANLANEAASFHDMAKQLKQKAKRDQERRIFGIF